MKITELTRKQQIALVAIMETLAMSDGIIADSEQETINSIVEELGDDTYRELLDDADEQFPDEDDLKNFLRNITDKEARETIYGIVMQEAMMSPSINHIQSEMLEWLRNAWNISVTES